MARIDHTNCTHPRTPAGRRACRAGNTTFTVADALSVASTMTGAELAANGKAKVEEYILLHGSQAAKRRINAENRSEEILRNAQAARQREDAQIRVTGATARKMARHAAAADKVRAPRQTVAPARIQPRRSGARVAARSSACVQAALHTSGRCACGWHAANFCNTAVYACAGH